MTRIEESGIFYKVAKAYKYQGRMEQKFETKMHTVLQQSNAQRCVLPVSFPVYLLLWQ